MAEVTYMHVNPYQEDLLKKCEDLNKPHKDHAETVEDISLVMNYVEENQDRALMGYEEGSSAEQSSPEDTLAQKLKQTMADLGPIEDYLDDEDDDE